MGTRSALLVTGVPLLARGIAAALRSEASYHAATTAPDLPSARTLLQGGEYDLVVCDEAAAVTDASLPRLQEQLATVASRPPLIVLVHGQLSTGVRQLAANATGSGIGLAVVDVSAHVDELRRAIAAVESGRSFIDPSLAGELLQSPAQPLTPREQGVFDHMVTGATNKEIAAVMHVSPETVKSHVTRILRKLDAPTRMAAVLQAQRASLVSHRLDEEPEIIHSAGVAVFSCGVDGAIISCNPAAADLYECDRTEVLGESLRFILPGSTGTELAKLRDELISGARSAAHLETRRTSSDGEELDLYVTISPIRDRRSDEVVGFSAISRPSPVPKRIGDLLDDARLAQLRSTGLLDSPPEERYDRFTRLAARVLHAPVALLTLVDDQRQYAKSSTERSGPLAAGSDKPLLDSFCAHVVAEGSALAIENARLDPRVSEMPAVIDGEIAAYASSPIVTRSGHTLGALCVFDDQPRDWKPEDRKTLHDLAAIAAGEIDHLLEDIASRELAADARDLVAETRDGVENSRAES